MWMISGKYNYYTAITKNENLKNYTYEYKKSKIFVSYSLFHNLNPMHSQFKLFLNILKA